MKKTFKNAILGSIFALCCVFGFFACNVIVAKVNATEVETEEVQGETEDKNEENLENNEEENVDVEHEIENENNENQEQETPVKDEEITKEELKEELKEGLIEIKEWIIALIASFLGTGGLIVLVKVLLNKWFDTQQTNLKTKLDEMEQEKQIAVEQKELILKQFGILTEQFNKVLEHNEKLCDYISSKIKADEEKLFKTNQLLQALLPVLEEEKSDVDEE